MLISISYYLGDSSQSKYFDDYTEAVMFIKKLHEVHNTDFLHFDFYVYMGEEEKRVRKVKNEQR